MSLAQSLDHLHRRLSQLWADSARLPGDLSYSEYQYLRAIERLDGGQIAVSENPAESEKGPAVPAENDCQAGHHLQDLVQLLGVQKASASAAIAKLEKRGLLVRFGCKYDARAQHIILTEQGREHLRGEEVLYRDAAKRMAAGLTPEDEKTLTSLLEKAAERA
ncbi:MarR family winged helix-turn-helix transcriptional regulator [Kiloniella laminariae]|uniref:MarR family winged helix-turn-helix transcriptional regulator n=1 Tax=Kiloniella laminariae TaxID=454162 RepID=UPI00036B842B|nr:MarR family winged helix-turn-helix transcriptional regulator [Kiloniella laminariae]